MLGASCLRCHLDGAEEIAVFWSQEHRGDFMATTRCLGVEVEFEARPEAMRPGREEARGRRASTRARVWGWGMPMNEQPDPQLRSGGDKCPTGGLLQCPLCPRLEAPASPTWTGLLDSVAPNPLSPPGSRELSPTFSLRTRTRPNPDPLPGLGAVPGPPGLLHWAGLTSGTKTRR